MPKSSQAVFRIVSKLTVAVVLLFAAIPSAVAQNTTSLPWWTSPVVNDIGLSQEQTQKIRQVVRSYRDRLFDARNSASKAEAELQDMLNDATVNPAAAKPLIEHLAEARATTTRVFTSMSVEIRAVLTQEQWRQLVRRWSDVQRTRRNRETDVAP
jgi:Spy/CpxP family protein refolding chaperone